MNKQLKHILWQIVAVASIAAMGGALAIAALYDHTLKRAWADVWQALEPATREELSSHVGWWNENGTQGEMK